MTAPQPCDRQARDNWRKGGWQRAEAALRTAQPGAGAYAVVFIDDAGSPASVVATFPGPMSAEMYGKIIGGRFRVLRMDPAHHAP
ncbi:hypothetical protein [Frankia sp. CcWB3]